MKTHRRHKDLDRPTFQKRWREEHAERVLAEPDVRKWVRGYTQLHPIGAVEPGAPFYHPATALIDGVTVMGFASMRDAEFFLLSAGNAAMMASEADITVLDAAHFWTGVNFTIVDDGHR